MPQTWPATLPFPANEFEQQQADVSARTGDQFGVKTTRRRMTHAPTACSVSFVLTQTEKTALDTFFNSTCNAGSYWFTAAWLQYALSPHHQARIVEYDCTVISKSTAGLLYSVEMDLAICDKGEIIDGYLHPWYDVNGV